MSFLRSCGGTFLSRMRRQVKCGRSGWDLPIARGTWVSRRGGSPVTLRGLRIGICLAAVLFVTLTSPTCFASGMAESLPLPRSLEEFQRTTDLDKLNPSRFAMDMVTQGEFRFIALGGFVGSVPGILDAPIAPAGASCDLGDPYLYWVPRTSDDDSLDSETRRALERFARRYNRVVLRELKKLGILHMALKCSDPVTRHHPKRSKPTR